MNLQRIFNRAVLLGFVLSLSLVFLLYFFTINKSLERELNNELTHAANLQALSVDFTFRTFETDIEALGSRTMIRKELYHYTLGERQLPELIDFTQTKYTDGASVIENLIGVRRVLTDGTTVSSFGEQKLLQNKDLTDPGLFLIHEPLNAVMIIKPILEAGDTIGYDAGFFHIGFLYENLPDNMNPFRLIRKGNSNEPKNENGIVSVEVPGQPFFLEAEINPDLLHKRNVRVLISVLTHSFLVIIVIALVFYLTLFRLVKKIIIRLYDSEKLLNSTQQLAKAGGWDYNPENKEIHWTKGTFQIFEIPPLKSASITRKVIYKALFSFQKKDRKDLIESIKSCIQEEKSIDKEYPVTTVAGNSKFLRIVLYPYLAHEKVNKVTGTIIDVTDQKTAEKEQREKLELGKKVVLAEEALRFKQNFLANMSHELRTPLNGIMGMTEILQMTPLTKDQQDYVETLSSSGENLKNLVDKILDFSKIEAGNIQLNKERFSFEVFARKLEDYFYRICDKPIDFQLDIHDAVPKWLITDETRIFEVSRQLISNAVKFTGYGKIMVRVDMVNEWSDNDEVMMKVSVSDTGIGMIKEVKEVESIDPFLNLHKTDIRNYDGAGLGLATSQRLVSLLRGQMGFDSKPGKGSVVWFTFVARKAGGHQTN
ncbi:MAG: sensor histidine kinase [Bacteroidota bacterium]